MSQTQVNTLDEELKGWTIHGIYPPVPELQHFVNKEAVGSTTLSSSTAVAKRPAPFRSNSINQKKHKPNSSPTAADAIDAAAAALAPVIPVVDSNDTSKKRRILPHSAFNAREEAIPVSQPTFDPKRLGYYMDLSDEQKAIHDEIVNSGESMFFTGSAGTGKSVLLKALIKTLQNKYGFERVAVTASTGIAACNIGGTTIHSFAHVGIGNKSVDEYVQAIRRAPMNRRSYEKTTVLIIDEVSMIDPGLLDLIEQVSRRVRKINEPFGGIQVVLCGDFHQLPPVHKKKVDGYEYAFQAHCWDSLVKKTRMLKKTWRQEDGEFAAMLNEIRIGKISEQTNKVFNSLARQLRPALSSILPTELYPNRADVDKSNMARLASLEGETHVYKSIDNGSIKALSHCMATSLLSLKVGAQVMLIKNLSSLLVNGSIGVVEKFEPYERQGVTKLYPYVKFSNNIGRLMTEEIFDVHVQDGSLADHTRVQIPLLLAWALSIHKAQGQTIEYVRVDLKKVFAPGQAYVGLSRAKSLEKLQVLNFEKELVKADPVVSEFYRRVSFH